MRYKPIEGGRGNYYTISEFGNLKQENNTKLPDDSTVQKQDDAEYNLLGNELEVENSAGKIILNHGTIQCEIGGQFNVTD